MHKLSNGSKKPPTTTRWYQSHLTVNTDCEEEDKEESGPDWCSRHASNSRRIDHKHKTRSCTHHKYFCTIHIGLLYTLVYTPITDCQCRTVYNIRVSNRSAGMISSRFPGDIFMKIQQNLQFYQHLPVRVTNPWDHTDPVYPSNSSGKGHLPGTDSPNIN